jgi:hypothetical protein
MPALLEGMRRDFPEVVSVDLDLEGGRERLEGNKYDRACRLQRNASNCLTTELTALRANGNPVKRLEVKP